MDLSVIVRGIIKKRRNISPESFNGKPVDRQIIQEMLEAANWAPTHGQTEPWRFVVYEGEKVADFGALHAGLYKEHTPKAQFVQKKYETILNRGKTTSHIIVMMLQRGDKKNIPLNEEIAAVACAAQNMMLVAASHNIGTYWGTGGMCYHPSMKAAFNLDQEEDQIIGFLFVGKINNDDFPEGKRQTNITDKVKWI